MEEENNVLEDTDAVETEKVSDEEASCETEGTEQETEKKKSRFTTFLNRFFHFEERGSSIKQEICAGLGMCFVSICMFLVYTNIISTNFPEVTESSAYMASAIIAFVGTLLIGLLCNLPFSQTAGLSTATMFVYVASANTGLTYYNLLFISFVAAIVYVVIAATPIRKWLLKAVPSCVKNALPVAIGVYMMVIALDQTGLISVSSEGGIFALFSLTSASDVSGTYTIGYLAGWIGAIAAIVLYFVFKKLNLKHPALYSFLIATVVFFLVALVSGSYSTVYALNRLWFVGSEDAYGIGRAFKETEWLAMFTRGTDFSAFTEAGGNVALVFIQSVLLFVFMSMFESQGTAKATSAAGAVPLWDETNEDKMLGRVMLANSIANVAAPFFGATPVSVSKSSTMAGADGGKTGLASVICSIGFLIAIFTWAFFILFATWTDLTVEWYYGHYGQCMEYYCTAQFSIAFAMLFVMGLTSMKGIKECNFADIDESLPFALTVVGTLFTMNIVCGVAFGLITYAVMKLLSFKKDKILSIGVCTTVLTLVLLAYVILAYI